MTTTEQQVEALHDLLTNTLAHIHAAIRNLNENTPGYPTTTPGNGSPGHGKSGGTRTLDYPSSDGTYMIDQVPVTSVEAAFTNTGQRIANDPAIAELNRIRTLVRELHRPTRELHDLTQKWGYPNAGDWTATPRRTAQPTETETNAERWCTSCARLHRAEPVYRGTLCHWCYTFNATEGQLPPISILDHRGRGRITQAMVKRALQTTGKPPTRPRTRKRRNLLA